MPLYSYSPVVELKGISKKRALVLARMKIYSVKQFIEALPDENALKDLAVRLSMSEDQLNEILQEAKQVIEKLSRKRPVWKLAIGFFAISFGIILLGFGVYAHSSHFTDVIIVCQTLHIYENHHEDEWKEDFDNWTVKTDVYPMKNGHDEVSYHISRSWSQYTADMLESFPQGFIIQIHSDSYELLSSKANLVHEIIGTVPADEPGWVTEKIIKKTTVEIPVQIYHYPEINEVIGESFLFEFNRLTSKEPRVDPKNHYRLEVFIKLRNLERKSRFRKFAHGAMNTKIWLNVGEYEFYDVGKEQSWPGLTLNEKRREYQKFKLYATWHAPCPGRFILPKNVVSDKGTTFYNVNENMKDELVYETFGSLWLAYIAAIVSIPIIGWGGTILWKSR